MSSITDTPQTGVIVTGAASGIGRACAIALAEAGRPVSCWDLDGPAVENTAAEIADRFGVASHAASLDVSDTSRYAATLDAARAALSSLGGLVHAAGVSHAVPVDTLSDHDWDFVLAINLRAYPFLVQSLLPDLRKNPGSAVVGIASINAILGNQANPAYGASKAGLLGASRSMADRLAADGIRVNSVCPGYIDTPMMAAAFERPGLGERMRATSMLGRLGQPEEIAAAVRFLLSDQASFITAEELVVDGGTIRSQR